jgi:hypothetical protein
VPVPVPEVVVFLECAEMPTPHDAMHGRGLKSILTCA